LIYATSNYGPFIGGDAIGEKGKPAERVGLEAAENFIKPYMKNASIDKHLADMLVLPLSLASGKFVVDEVSKHLETSLYIVKEIIGCNYSIDRYDSNYMVTIGPNLE
jgi:RNA 3'-terminal phosphate cyclase (ATP)